MRVFTGGRDTVEEQRKLGGRHDLCNVYAYYYFLFEEDDGKLLALANECRTGSLVCGECKARLAKNVGRFIAEFQEKREKARDNLEDYLIK
jgi:tryptophanyl-tRNA synthetase